jgi:hypothetical protein
MRLMTTIALIGMGVLACSRQIDEKPELIEHRIEGCTKFCEVATHPECGADRSIDGAHLDSSGIGVGDTDKCIQTCAMKDTSLGAEWGQSNSFEDDQCVEQWHARTNCLAGLSCEEQRRYFTRDSNSVEGPCYDEAMGVLECIRAVRLENQGGGQ